MYVKPFFSSWLLVYAKYFSFRASFVKIAKKNIGLIIKYLHYFSLFCQKSKEAVLCNTNKVF